MQKILCVLLVTTLAGCMDFDEYSSESYATNPVMAQQLSPCQLASQGYQAGAPVPQTREPEMNGQR